MNPIRCVLYIALASCAAFGQAPPAGSPEFDVASVKPSVESANPLNNVSRGLHIDGAMVSYNGMPLKWYIRTAYAVKESQISGPDWLGSERFDIVAKLPSGATREQIPAMMQKLLADRFKLTLHRESKEFPVYALVVGKNGPKLKESPLDADTDDGPGKTNVDVSVTGGERGATVSLGKGASVAFEAQRLVAKKVTMAYLADSLARFLDRPVVDMTGLTGTYDCTIPYNLDDLRALILSSAPAGTPMPPRQAEVGETGVSLMDSLDALGLKLEPRKAPLDMLVVDHIDKVPSAN
jgi:uncharacterized protein (TIGR03435 family)